MNAACSRAPVAAIKWPVEPNPNISQAVEKIMEFYKIIINTVK